MMKLSALFCGLTLAAAVTGCGSKNDPTPSTPAVSAKTALLTAKNWRCTASTSVVTFYIGGQTTTTSLDGYAQFPSCRRDDFLKFDVGASGGTNPWTVDEGATRCTSTGPQTRTGTWSFNPAETQITLLDPTSPVRNLRNQVVEVPVLTATTLQTIITVMDTVNTIPRRTVATNTYAAI